MNARIRPLIRQTWYSAWRGLCGLAVVGLWRGRWYDSGHVPASSPLVVVANHQSHLDPVLVGVATRRQLHYLARDTLFWGLFGKFIHSLGAIPVDREGRGASGLKQSLRVLKRGEALVLFPEGTRSRDGRLAPLRPGFVTLAKRTGASILPVAIAGAYQSWPRQARLPGPGRVVLQFGQLLAPEQVAHLHQDDLVAEITEQLQQCLLQATGRRRRLSGLQ